MKDAFMGLFDLWFGLILMLICAAMTTAVYMLYRLTKGIAQAYKQQNQKQKARKVVAINSFDAAYQQGPDAVKIWFQQSAKSLSGFQGRDKQ